MLLYRSTIVSAMATVQRREGAAPGSARHNGKGATECEAVLASETERFQSTPGALGNS